MVIVGAIITGVFTLAAAFIQIFIERWAHWETQFKRRLAIWAGIIVVLLASATMGIYLSVVIPRSPQVTITIPAGTAATPAQITPGSVIEGHASDVHHDELFLMLRSTQGEGLRYYPQAQVNDWTGANWRAALNAPPGAGRYDLIAVAVTSSEAGGELEMYIQVCQTTACPGVDTIPPGIETLTSVPVIIP